MKSAGTPDLTIARFTKLMLVDTQCVITCGGVPIYPGDIIVVDS